MKVIMDLCVVPIGVGVSVSRYIAACERVLSGTGLETRLHAYGTNIEGEWDEVMAAVKACHSGESDPRRVCGGVSTGRNAGSVGRLQPVSKTPATSVHKPFFTIVLSPSLIQVAGLSSHPDGGNSTGIDQAGVAISN